MHTRVTANRVTVTGIVAGLLGVWFFTQPGLTAVNGGAQPPGGRMGNPALKYQRPWESTVSWATHLRNLREARSGAFI